MNNQNQQQIDPAIQEIGMIQEEAAESSSVTHNNSSQMIKDFYENRGQFILEKVEEISKCSGSSFSSKSIESTCTEDLSEVLKIKAQRKVTLRELSEKEKKFSKIDQNNKYMRKIIQNFEQAQNKKVTSAKRQQKIGKNKRVELLSYQGPSRLIFNEEYPTLQNDGSVTRLESATNSRN